MKTRTIKQLVFAIVAVAILLPMKALSATLSIEDFTIKPGETKTMYVDVNNADMLVTMVEFYMYLPNGLSVATEDGDLAVDIAGRTTWKKHSLEAQMDAGVLHVFLYSGSNATLSGTSGAVISVKLTAASSFTGGNITLKQQLLAAPNEEESKPADYTYKVTTGVSDAVTLTARSYTREYGEANPAFGYDVTSGSITSGTPTITCSATKTSAVGTYPIVISKGSVSNSDVTLVNGTLTITRAPLTVSAGNYTKQEGDPNPTFTPTFSGFKNNETKSVLTKQPTVTTTATTSSPAGTYPVTVSGAEAQNYSCNYVNGTLTVTAKPVVGDNITFADPEVKRLCVENWDTNNDGELSKQEAAAVTDLGWVFRENTTIKSFDELQFFTGIKRLDDETFSYCRSMTSITIPNSVTCIGLNAFNLCLGLTSITIPNSVTVIENMAFQLCVGLTSVTIPNSVTSIGVNPFMSCENLKEIILQSGNANYMMVDGVLFTKDMKTLIAYPCAKEGTTYSIPSSVTDIGYGAFRYCRRLVSISIPNSVTKILDRTFLECTRLKEVTISSSVKSIQYKAFYECRNLEKVISMINEPFAITDNVFHYYSNGSYKFTSATLYVPRGTKALYEATDGWKNFTKIVEMGTQLKGDVNGDGQVDVADIATVIDIIAGKDVDTPEDKAPAGAEAVDLGLPSGTLWANMNIGAEKAEGYGLFFAWGETTGYGRTDHAFGWANYKWMTAGQSSRFGVNKYQAADGLTAGCWYDAGGNFIGGGKTELDPDDDAARANWGGQWVMPTKADMRELIDNTTNKETTQNGVKGWVFTSKTNGKSIFFPYAGFSLSGTYAKNGLNGYYWSSTLRTDNSFSAENLFIYKNGVNVIGNERDGGFPIRAVKKAK